MILCQHFWMCRSLVIIQAAFMREFSRTLVTKIWFGVEVPRIHVAFTVPGCNKLLRTKPALEFVHLIKHTVT